MIVLGIDPGFALLGMAAVDVTPDHERVVATAVLRTEKSARKLDVRASDDNVRRGLELARGLCIFCSTHRPVAFACEAQSWPRNAGSSAKVGLAWGVVIGVAYRFQVPIVQASPQQIKKVLCGRKDASKEDVIAAVEDRFPGVEWPSPASVVEHAADAVGAVLACTDSPTIQMARKISSPEAA